jgi:hypothetical protein
MKKQVAGTIMSVDTAGASFLVQQQGAQYSFYNFPVITGQTPLGSVLSKLREEVGLDVDQLRLFDSVIAELDDEKVALFVFNNLTINDHVRALFAKQDLQFVAGSQLHQLFESVHVNTQPLFEQLSK